MSASTTLDDLRRFCRHVLQLPAGTPFYSVDVSEALLPIAVARAELLRNCPDDVRAEIDRLSSVRRGLRGRKHAGTGKGDTPEETWTAMRAASLSGENLRSISRRFGVLYTAIVRRAWRDDYDGLPWKSKVEPDNVVELFALGSGRPVFF